MKSRTFLAGITTTIVAATLSTAVFAQTSGTLTPVSAPQPAAPRPAVAVMNSLPVPDKGTFRILLSGAEVGTEQFELAASGSTWTVRSESTLRVPESPENRSTGELHISADGTPLGYKWTAQAEKKASGVVEFTDGTAKTAIILAPSSFITRAVSPSAAAQAVPVSSTASIAIGNDLVVGTGDSQEMVTVAAMTPTSFTAIFGKSHGANSPVSKPYEQDFIFPSPHVAILDNNLYSQYGLVALLYDWNAKGQQTFPVLIPQDMTPGTISVESVGQRTIEGSTFDTLRVNTADLELLAYYDARHRLMRVEVPAAMVTIVRR